MKTQGWTAGAATGVLGLWSGPACASASASVAGMSMGAIVADATPTVKFVMVLLLGVSILSWTVLVRKVLELHRLFKSTASAENQLLMTDSLEPAVTVQDPRVQWLINDACEEMARSRSVIAAGITEGVNARVALLLERVEDAAARQIGTGVGLFATAATVTPFVGLFGTVWGIMHSFIGIAQANNTSLAVVAPGIAEALLATAVGLAVAIPATVMYNVIGKQIGEYRARFSNCSARVACLVSRDVERLQLPHHAAALRAVKEA